ncbi:hypothetical protein [Actinomadura miaoliensis]|uniref:Uncharacterized protein n=1 Tax=Actinomadura miaoliensis TaxID=430685 RepID=A0ABP7X3Q6_9ACTN
MSGPGAAECLEREGCYVLPAVRVDPLRWLGRAHEAVAAWDAAIARTGSAAEQGVLRRGRVQAGTL